MKKHKIVAVQFTWSGTTKYKLAIRKYLFGIKWLGYWVYVEDKDSFDTETGEYRTKLFDSQEEALNHLKTL